MNQDYILKIENVKKYYPIDNSIFLRKISFIKSVDGVSFNIERGKSLGLVGESGCGKSTISRCILNLIEPTYGRVEFQDKIIYDVENKINIDKKEMIKLRKDMQIIFQDPYSSLDPKMTIGKIISSGIKKHQIAQGEYALNLAKDMLNLCGLDESYINRYPHELSGGQRQRIGIARALSLNPKFVICDEPTAALDVSVQAQILNLMLDLKDKLNLTYLFISHNLNVVKFFCDEIAVMYLGVIVEKAPSYSIYNKPFHPYTKGLISSIQKHIQI
ncbi:ATP-binding cassette domain-containing protein [Clostridioides difficile]|uniref:ATP-binding cassette domain-containing protein n=1 Tax=Clostridioides difficile TaxID=1496 RepID=UPI002ED4D4EE